MMTISFFLKEPKSTDETMIYMSVSFSGSRKKYSTTVPVKPTQWNGNRVKPLAKDSTLKNLKLENMEQIAKDIERESLLKNETLVMDEFTSEFVKRFAGVLAEKKEDFFSIFTKFIEAKKLSVSANTIKTYKTLEKHLKEYSESLKDPITFDGIDLNFYDDFVNYLFGQGKRNNTVDKNLTILKTFMKWTEERNFHSNGGYSKFKGLEVESEKINLPPDYVDKLKTTDFGELYKNLVRDVFLIGCYTGLRFSDIQNIEEKNVNGDFLSVFVTKTREKLDIPLLDDVKAIFDRHFKLYEGRLKVPTNQECNREIKILLEKVGFNSPISNTTKAGNKNITERKPACEFISMHDARRFFITQCIMKGMTQEVITKITGHKDYKSFRKYFKPSKETIGGKLKEAWTKKKAD